MNTFLDFEALLLSHRADSPLVMETFVPLAYAPVRRLAACLLADPAQTLVSFPIRTPEILPKGFTLSTFYIFHDPETDFEAVSILYVETTGTQTAYLIVTESSTNPVFFDYAIGRYAHVSAASVGNLKAEFVFGGWAYPNPAPPLTDPNGKIHLEYFWDDELPSFWLRWQENALYFSMLYAAPFDQKGVPEIERFSTEAFFRIAQSLR